MKKVVIGKPNEKQRIFFTSKIASLEVGKRNISIVTLEKIVIALEVSLCEFFDFNRDNI